MFVALQKWRLKQVFEWKNFCERWSCSIKLFMVCSFTDEKENLLGNEIIPGMTSPPVNFSLESATLVTSTTLLKWYYNKNNLNVPTCCPIWGVQDYVTQFVKCHSITSITITSTLTICDSKQDIACGHILSDLLFRITHSERWQSNKNNHKLVLWLQTLLNDCLVWVQ